jgi:hypothetical protein
VTVTTLVNDAGADISLGTQGCVIATSVTNNASGTAQVVTGQASQCAILASSKVGCLSGQGGCKSSAAILPPAAVAALAKEPTGSSIYVTEIFYTYHTVTPIVGLLGKSVLPSQLYSVAYY